MKTFIVGLLLSVAASANAATCAVQQCASGQAEPCPCEIDTWIPTVPPGWATVPNGWQPTTGWVKACTSTLGTYPMTNGYCFKRYVPPGTTLTLSVLDNLDYTTANFSFHIRSWQSNLAGTSQLYDSSSCSGGSFTNFGSGLWTFNTVSTWDTSCLVLRN